MGGRGHVEENTCKGGWEGRLGFYQSGAGERRALELPETLRPISELAANPPPLPFDGDFLATGIAAAQTRPLPHPRGAQERWLAWPVQSGDERYLVT